VFRFGGGGVNGPKARQMHAVLAAQLVGTAQDPRDVLGNSGVRFVDRGARSPAASAQATAWVPQMVPERSPFLLRGVIRGSL